MANLILDAIYRFNRSNNLRYYRARRTKSDMDFLYPISIDGSRVIDEAEDGRQYVILYVVTKWGKLGAGGYWLTPKRKTFERIYVTDATIGDLALVAHNLDELPDADQRLDDILNRFEVPLDMDVWGELMGGE